VNLFETRRNGPVVLKALTGPDHGRYLAGWDPDVTWTGDPAAAYRFPDGAAASGTWRSVPALYAITVGHVPARDLQP
jgi:hypothetical protein